MAADHEEVNRQRREETAARAGKERELTEVRRLWHVGGLLRVEPDRRRARRIVLATGIELAQAAE